jgi:hypothetical protein
MVSLSITVLLSNNGIGSVDLSVIADITIVYRKCMTSFVRYMELNDLSNTERDKSYIDACIYIVINK